MKSYLGNVSVRAFMQKVKHALTGKLDRVDGTPDQVISFTDDGKPVSKDLADMLGFDGDVTTAIIPRFSINLEDGGLYMHTANTYIGPSFRLNNGYLEVGDFDE